MARGGAARKKVQYTKNVGSQGKANPNVQALPRTVQSQNLTALQGVQWPANLPTDKPYPDMPKVSDTTPLLQQYGASGVAIFSGIITSEEYNPDFFWRDGVKIYEQMLRNDGQIAAVRDMVELPIRRATWSIEPFSDSARDREIASFVESCLFHDMQYQTTEGRTLTQKWDDILRHILMHVWYGFMAFEVNWKVEDGWTKWASWTPLLPRTIWRWWVGEDNELVGIQQWTFKNYSYQFINIPAEKVLLFVNRQEGQNFEGVSALRQAYKDWFYKVQYEKIQAIGIERNAVIPPVVKLPENFTSHDVQMAQMIGQNMRANELMSVTLPPGWDLEFPKNQQRYAANSLEAIQYHDTMMARRMLCQFLDLGSKETGSYALADTQVQTFLSALQTTASYVEDVINCDAIYRLVDYNFDNVEGYPKLKASRLQADIKVISDALKSVLGQNALLTPYPELQSWFADQLGIPSPPEGQTDITATNPTKPTNPMQPEQPANQQGKQDNAGTKQVSGSPVDDGGNIGNMLSELHATTQLLRESFTAMDAVERGETHLQLYNPYHYPAGQRGGQFAPKGGGIGGGGGFGRSGGGEGVTHVSHHAAGTSGGGARSPASGSHATEHESVHERSARLQREGHLERESTGRTWEQQSARMGRDIDHVQSEMRRIESARTNGTATHEDEAHYKLLRAEHERLTGERINVVRNSRAMSLKDEADSHEQAMRTLERTGFYNRHPEDREEATGRLTALRSGKSALADHESGVRAHTEAIAARVKEVTGVARTGSSTRSRSTDDRISRLEARMTRAESAHSAERAAHAETKRQLKQAQKELARVQRENETLRARAEGTKSSRSSGSRKASKVVEDLHGLGLHPIRTGISHEQNFHGHPDARYLHRLYGTRQLPTALGRATHESLRGTAREVGAKAGRTKAETIKNITEKMVQEQGVQE